MPGSALAWMILLCGCADAPPPGDGVDGWIGFVPPDLSAGSGGDLAEPDLTQLGATVHGGGTMFRVWAPNADSVAVSGDFNQWSASAHPMVRDSVGVWSLDVAGAQAGQGYRFVIVRGAETFKRHDPRARAVNSYDGPSVIVDPRAFAWQSNFVAPPANQQVIYELHLGTFSPAPGATWGSFDSAATRLDHLQALGINMIELMPPAEFNGSKGWGYNPQFPFAVESSYGGPEAMRRFVDAAHARGIGVIVDIVHNHWTSGAQPMSCFDGDCKGKNGIYFYTDAARASTPWGPRPDFGRSEVRDYLRDSAITFLDEYRCDGFRWDSTLNIRAYNDGANPIPEGLAMLRAINDVLHARFPRAIQIAEDFRNDDGITRSSTQGGTGFDAQWDPAFFHPVDDAILKASDAERSMASIRDALMHRHNGSGFQRVAYSESHDEVANGKKRIPETISPGAPDSLAARKRSTLGAALVLTAPAVPMLFMGMELLTGGSFADQQPLDWSRAQSQAGILSLYRDLIALRRNLSGTTRGLVGEYISVHHVNDSAKVIAFHRRDAGGPGDDVIVVANFGNKAYTLYDVGVPRAGTWHIRFNSDDKKYSADFSGSSSADAVTLAETKDGFPQKLPLPLGPYAVLVLSQ